MSRTVMRAPPPVMIISYGPPAFIAGKVTRHSPLVSAVAVLVWLLSRTETDVFGGAHPDTVIATPRCSTRPSLKSLAGRSVDAGASSWVAAHAVAANATAAGSARASRDRATGLVIDAS